MRGTMSEQPSYEELVQRNRRLANKIVRMGDEFQTTLRTEIRKAKVSVWDEGAEHGVFLGENGLGLEPADNPYREER